MQLLDWNFWKYSAKPSMLSIHWVGLGASKWKHMGNETFKIMRCRILIKVLYWANSQLIPQLLLSLRSKHTRNNDLNYQRTTRIWESLARRLWVDSHFLVLPGFIVFSFCILAILSLTLDNCFSLFSCREEKRHLLALFYGLRKYHLQECQIFCYWNGIFPTVL